MLHVIGLEKSLQTVVLVTSHDGRLVSDAAGVRRGYRQLRERLQPAPQLTGDAMEWIVDGHNWDLHCDSYLMENVIHDGGVCKLLPAPEVGRHLPRIRASVEAVLAEDEAFSELFQLLFPGVFLAHSDTGYGGTSSSLLGCLWMDPRHEWAPRDLTEFLYHELGHMLMFFDERRFMHFLDVDAIGDRKNYALTAIRGNERPLDKVIHSIVIATDILVLRQKSAEDARSLIHPDTATLGHQTMAAIASARAVPRGAAIMAPRTFELMDICEGILRGLSLRKAA